uniref:Large ribosomal subunit protein uL23c n=1 Tax=prasinophyte sp. MBIC10622 TaxID=156113 RepID=A0A088CIU3_9CHLO|nr:ribosomal protein L23 [prasinophyte sp. MBIC10622]
MAFSESIKGIRMTQKGVEMVEQNRYSFRVTKNMKKPALKRLIETTWGVQVDKITMANPPRRSSRAGLRKVKRAHVKNAVVSLKKSESLSLFTSLQDK